VTIFNKQYSLKVLFFLRKFLFKLFYFCSEFQTSEMMP